MSRPLGAGYGVALDLAAGAWIGGFSLFVVLYAPLYLGNRFAAAPVRG